MRKKILFVHHAGGLGGAPRSLMFLINKLDKEKYEPIVLITADGPVVEQFKKLGIKVITDKTMRPYHGTTVSGMNLRLFIKNNLFLINTYLKAKEHIKAINPDLIHLNSTCLFAVAKAGKKLGIKVVTHVREPLLDNVFGSILRELNYRYVDGYISICKNDESKLKVGNKKSRVIYNFVDLKQYDKNLKSDILKKELNLEQKDMIVLSLSRIAESNGILECVKMINELQIDAKIKFVFLGFSGQNGKYEISTSKEIEKNSNTYKLNMRNDIPEVIASSDIIISPFKVAHFSRAIIEGAAMGKPAIGTDVGGINELIINGVSGELFNLHDSESFKKKLNLIIDNYDEYSKNAHEYAFNSFNSDKNASETISFLEEFMI